jgi:hypothetical protein
MAGAGLLAAMLPVLGGATPAVAQEYDASGYGSLTFITYEGDGITCPLQVQSSHDTSANTASIYAAPLGEARCIESNVATSVTITYKDQNGLTHTSRARGDDIVSLSVDHAKSNVRTSATTSYNDCNPNASASCDLTVTANPK